jgi:hypothetical protein
MGFSAHFEFQPGYNYDFYAMEVMLNLANPPENLSQVRFVSPQELIAELESARDQELLWDMDEVGIFHQDRPDRNDGVYFGSAKLVAINGIETDALLPIKPRSRTGRFCPVHHWPWSDEFYCSSWKIGPKR